VVAPATWEMTPVLADVIVLVTDAPVTGIE
jgi:hypothetical protein